MEENIVVNVEIDRNGVTTTSVQVVPLDIPWEDFELMLKVFADKENIDVFYKDNENDFIRVSSQEELELALMLAKSADSTLHLKVSCESCQVPETSDRSSITKEASAPSEEECPRMGADEMDQAQAAAKCDRPCKRKYFFLKHAISDLVLDVAECSRKPGTRVILFGKKKTGVGNQLWYFEEFTQTLRSQFCGLCLEVSASNSMVDVYKEGCQAQTWKMDGFRIRHATKQNCVVGVTADTISQGSKVVTCEESGDKRLDWIVEYVDSRPHHCPRRAPHCRAFPTYGTHCHRHYSDLAQAVSQKLYGGQCKNPGQVGGASEGDGQPEVPTQGRYNMDIPDPPQWMLDCLTQMKSEMVNEVSNAVAAKTVSQVLKGLEGAVITSVPGSSGIMQPPSAAPGSQQPRPAYHHEGILCDKCTKTIVGVRYKCGNCEDFDLCSDCEALSDGNSHPSDHVFLKIYRPVMSAGRKMDGSMVPLLRHNIYLHNEKMEKQLQNPSPVHFGKKEEVKQSAPTRPPHKDPIEKLKRKQEKLRKKVEKTEEKIKKKEKRRLGEEEELFGKKEKLELPQFRVPDRMEAEFVCDVTFPDGTHIQPGTRFCKKWTVRNTGSSPWTDGTRLMMIWGNMKPVEEEVEVPYTGVGDEVTIATQMVAPKQPGTYQSHWRLAYCGLRFGQRVWCSIVVDVEDSQNLPKSCDREILRQKEGSEQAEGETHVQGTNKEDETFEYPDSVVVKTGKREVKFEKEDMQENTDNAEDTRQEEPVVKAKPSQTATPNNTPLESRDPSPPQTPHPEELESERIWSLSDTTTPDFISEAGSCDRSGALSAERLSECMARMDLQPPDIDLESLDSVSTTSSEDTDEDFYVVPIPDCFNPTLPASRQTSTTLLVKKDESQSSKLEKDPNSVETSPDSVETTPLLEAAEYEHQPLQTTDQQSSVAEIKTPPEVSELKPEVEKLPAERTNEIGEDSEPVRMQDTAEVGAVKSEEKCEKVHRETEMKEEESEVTGVKQRSNEVKDEATSSQENDSPSDNSQAGDQNAASASNMVATAIDMAAKATNTAVNTCKNVFNTLQGNQEYVPSESKWTPKDSTWAPTEENWTPPGNQWTPSQPAWVPQTSQWTPPDADMPRSQETTQASPMEQLVEMGFANRQKNEELLKHHDNDLEKVIQALVSMSMEWNVNRH